MTEKETPNNVVEFRRPVNLNNLSTKEAIEVFTEQPETKAEGWKHLIIIGETQDEEMVFIASGMKAETALWLLHWAQKDLV